ncbi:MAG TPA: M23 family metallopeptidase [Epsilonproteobacteria bacterium]|nr:M23 family metallopeptidase [Campylobacterota bacterium]HHH37621.1 M23 family metallopeptidase [Campylobacterota bacterium]
MVRRRGRKSSSIGWIILLILIIGGGIAGAIFLYTAKDFERVPPTIETPQYSYWNAKDALKIKILDNYGLKRYQVTLSDGNSIVPVATADNLNGIKEKVISVKYPDGKLNRQAKVLILKTQATDMSKWNYLMGNSAEKTIKLKIDYRRPDVTVLANSYSIAQGGSALVIFQASDDDALAKLYVEAGGRKYKAQPYKKKGYFVSLFAWPFTEEDFQAKVIAQDKAGNSRAAEIPLYLKNRHYRISKIKASDSFIDGKITDLAEQEPKYMKDERLARLKSVNEVMRKDNEALIHAYTSKVSDKMVESWKINPFHLLKNGQKVASFGDHRYYYAKDKSKIISESYHLGYDMASTKMAPIFASNSGKVVFADYNGIYGNMPIINHGLGLYTLYGHCSTLLVKEGDEVHVGQMIAKTGMTGLAMGDHLHFGILVQGIEVRPVEWLDKKWIKDNIVKIFDDADKIIFNADNRTQTKK